MPLKKRNQTKPEVFKKVHWSIKTVFNKAKLNKEIWQWKDVYKYLRSSL